MQDRPDEEFVYAEDDKPEESPEGSGAGGAGQPGPADEVDGRPSTDGFAGGPGPADEVDRSG